VHAAAIPTAGLAAWQGLFESAGRPTIALAKGQTLLIHGAAGGVGSFAVQLAKWKGAKVIATARSENTGFVRELGADVVVDYTQERFEDAARDVDAVLDLVGGETQSRSWNVLKRGGVLASTVGIPSEEKAKEHGVRAVSVMAGQDPRILAEMARLVDEKLLQVVVSEVLPLARAREAQERLRTGHIRGKIVLEV
jgi:NADPH:quinone reductase-like Zn-dependent oxidoreductase